ncbi:hypothetical protein F2P56_012348 [Juglans regia]|uniref:UPF0481 protein At3g47200-like n=2 Tax=Juglans regia TaxID=51240 RepID=A0A6P9EV97_JUGRE|nr:UPF0481 protein At3g47200-like [Juglans regia]KAF5468172.1 hypothetical protein F2P56_012348 [Juglans regia]
MAVTGDSVTINTEGLASSLIEDTESHDLLGSRKCCIFKIPNLLYRQNETAFIPDAFSLGPIHHGHPNMRSTEKFKVMYLHGLITRISSPDTRKKRVIDLVNSIKDVEREAREYYAEPIEYTPEEFVKILVLDGCFIIELFRKKAYEELREQDDPIFSTSCMLQFLYHDLILLENQVPWIVLERLFNVTIQQTYNDALLLLAIRFFGSTFSPIPPPTTILPLEGVKHIVDLLRKWLVSSSKEEESNSEYWEVMPSTTALVEAGIKLVKGTSESILDVEFNDGILKIPPLFSQETTETVFRNLICFEQCYPNCESRLSSYAVLIGNLINTRKDMDILCENEIIDSWLNRKDAVQFFNKLYHYSYLKTFYYGRLCKKVNGYCQRRWPRWRAVLVRNYFNTPWAMLSTLAAIILLILSFLQTLYTMKR